MKKVTLKAVAITILAIAFVGCGRTGKKQTTETTITMPGKSYIGLWNTADNPPDDLTILEISSDEIKFEVGLLRKYTATGTAKVENGKIVFLTDNYERGTMQFNENGILFTVDDDSEYNFTIKIGEKQANRKVKYLYRKEGVNYICFDNATAYREIEDHQADESDLIISGKINPQNPGNIRTNATYKEFPTYLLFNTSNTMWKIFDDFGRIDWGWRIVNYYRIFHTWQITTFEPKTANIPEKDIQNIRETCLIFISPEDVYQYENWARYEDDRKLEYAQMGIGAVSAQKRYLSFTLFDGDNIIVDTKKKQNGITSPTALLYRQGYIPIMVSISGESEEGMEHVDEYIHSESGDGEPVFKHWSTLND